MSQDLQVLSNAVQTSGTGGTTFLSYSPGFTISASTTVTTVCFHIAKTSVRVKNVRVMLAGTALSSGTFGIDILKNQTTSIFGTTPVIATTVVANTGCITGGGAVTGYTLPVLVTTTATLNLVAGDSLGYTITGAPTLGTNSNVRVEVELQDTTGTP